MAPIRVIAHGAMGKLGQEMVRAICRDKDLKLVGAVDIKPSGEFLRLQDVPDNIPLSSDLNAVLNKYPADVMVDFTSAKASMNAARLAAKKGVNVVICTTGQSAAELDELKQLATSSKIGLVIAPNFALGSVLMVHLARIAAKYMEHAEIIELHHDQKADAPSGTALNTARAMSQAKGKRFVPPPPPIVPSESRGQEVEGIPIHAVRLPGLMAHQEVIFGAPGQTLIIRHDTINRECYAPGVLLAIKEVLKRPGFTYGLDTLLGL